MGESTNIEWTDATWNPVMGCSEVSPGCDNCYARREMTRYGRAWQVTRAAKGTFYAPLRWATPRRIFTASWSDLFHPHVPEEWLQEIWDIMLATPQHTYQVLTKRPGRMAWWAKRHGWPDHIWAGTSVESAKYLPRLDVLARVPAKVWFVSCEPLLSPLDLRPCMGCEDCANNPDRDVICHCGNIEDWAVDSRNINWVIVGGESGPNARPMHPDWVRSIRDQCQAAGVPFFFKQWGEYAPSPSGVLERVGKARAGAVLDGREWREVPSPPYRVRGRL